MDGLEKIDSYAPQSAVEGGVLNFDDAVVRIRELESELQCMSGVMRVMKEDLQIKDEQFDFLYASIRARNEQHAHMQRTEDDYLRARVLELESTIRHRDTMNYQLQTKLKNVQRQLYILENGTTSSHSQVNRIPDELMYRIFSYLPAIGLAAFSITSRRYRELATSQSLWKSKFKREWGPGAVTRWITKQRERGGQPTSSGKEQNVDGVDWSRSYGDRHLVDLNLRKGCAYTHACRGHNGTITCLALSKSGRGRTRVFSGSDDGSVILWDISPTTTAHVIHSTDAHSLAIEEEKHSPALLPPPTLPLVQLVEGGERTTWSSWKPSYSRSVGAGAGAELPSMSTSPPQSSFLHSHPSFPPDPSSPPSAAHGSSPAYPTSPPPSFMSMPRSPPVPSRLRTYHGHGGPVWAVDCDDVGGWMVSGSYDQCIKVWDTASQQCQGTLRGHDGWVSSLAVLRRGHFLGDEDTSSARVASVSYDTTLKIWNPVSGDLLSSVSVGPGNALYCMALEESESPNVVAVGCRQCDVQCWDVDTLQLMSSYLGHSKDVFSVVLSDTVCFSGSGDSNIKMWDRRTGSCAHTYTGHRGSVMALQYDGDYRLMSGSYDKTVKMWDIRSARPVGNKGDGPGLAPNSAVATMDVYYPVFCLQFIDTTGALVVGSTDYKLRVYDFSHFR